MFRKKLWVMLYLVFIFMSADSILAETRTKIVLVFDNTASGVENLEIALDKMEILLKQLKLESGYEIIVISLNNNPKIECKIKGEKFSLRIRKHILESLKLNKETGTDVCGALDLAAWELSRSPIFKDRYLYVFSDLVVDDGRNIISGEPVHFRSLGEFDWNSLSGIHSEFHFVKERIVRELESNLKANSNIKLSYSQESKYSEINAPEEKTCSPAGNRLMVLATIALGIMLIIIWQKMILKRSGLR